MKRYLVPTNPEHTNPRTKETLEHQILELQKSLEHKNPSNLFLGPLAGWLVGWLAGGVRGGMPWVGVVGHWNPGTNRRANSTLEHQILELQ